MSQEITKKKSKQTSIQHTILVVDDEEAYVSSIESLLSKDYQVLTALSGMEALDIINQLKDTKEISVIISDQRMPGMTGIELLEKVKEIIPDTIRVVLTAYDDKHVILAAINEAKVYEFIMKSVEPEEIRHKVRQCIGKFEDTQRIKELALVDELTSLYNTRYIREFLPHIIEEIKRSFHKGNHNSILAFFFLDIDLFKRVNTLFGYSNGDRVLQEFSEVLKKTCRGSDIIARKGGEEFLVISHVVDEEDSMKFAERLRSAIEEHNFNLKDNPITCSIGVSCYPFLKNDPKKINWEEIIEIAGIANRTAKNSGRNACVGIFSTVKTDPNNLYQKIQGNINKLITGGELEARSSIDPKTLIWP